ncbi:protein PAXX isoform X3 [Struthio camelus]|uniref:protein PAXX isoform X3 n=1 Tax=Struthio camelus TaxID=8801 RepID=UPI003603CF09
MAEPAGPFRVLLAGPLRYLCYCRPGPGPGPGVTVYVTDGQEIWAGELAARPPLGRTSQSTLCLSEDHSTKLREALERGVVSLSLHDNDSKATLQLQEEACCSTFDLFKLPFTEARTQLQALMFSLVGCVKSLEKRLEAAVGTLGSSCSPEKNTVRSQQLFMPDPSPRKNRGASSTLPAKRRVPGESLINPGFKSLRPSLHPLLARRHHLEWTLKIPDLCCPIPLMSVLQGGF